MRYFYDHDRREFVTEDELRAEYANDSAKGYTEAESADDYIWNFLDYSGVEITEKIYNERYECKAVRQAIALHIASNHGFWDIRVSDDGEAWKLTLEGDPVCSIELANVIPALDYLYSVIDFDSTEEEDIEAMAYMRAEWGF